jgi:N-acetyltransferase
MTTRTTALNGQYIRLEPLEIRHAPGLAAAAAVDPALYRWSPVPQGVAEARRYVETALTWQSSGTAIPYATIRRADGAVIGSTRFWNLERWAWPATHPHDPRHPDACEIGYSWLARDAVRTAANTESKLLMLTFAFEKWRVLRVCFHADVRNERSQAALERVGAHFEGILRAHRLAVDLTARDSARYSITAQEWPTAKANLKQRLQNHGSRPS